MEIFLINWICVLHVLSHLPPSPYRFNYAKCIKLKFFRESRRANCGGGRLVSSVMWLCQVQSGACLFKCTTCDPLTAADKPLSGWTVVSGRKVFICSERNRRMKTVSLPAPSCVKDNHFINCGPLWHDLTINPPTPLKSLIYHRGPPARFVTTDKWLDSTSAETSDWITSFCTF